jgi:nitrate/TMAO reductase-like tetraheme cytochrome c subunit
MRPLLTFALLLAAALGTADPAAAQTGPNDTCLMCHSDTTAKGSAGHGIGVDKAKFAASAHGAMGVKCADCHADAAVDKLPHRKVLKKVDCTGCHEDAVKEYTATAHAKARATGNAVAATCQDCHGAAHEVLKHTNAAARTNRANVEDTCATCHGNDKIVQQAHLPGGNVQAKYHDGIHDKTMVGKSGYASQAPTCTSCHGAHSILSKKDPASRVSRAHIADTCGACHQDEKAVFDKGAHGKLLQAGITAGPNCADCHGAHNIEKSTSPKWQVAVIGSCGNCHTDIIKSYRLTYHGKVTDLGFTKVATCAACHGEHDVRPASDPLSKIAAVNREETCRNCHKNATVQFASWDPHPEPTNKERSLTLYYTNIFMNVLLGGVFAFFGLHTVLWAYRSFRVVQERRKGGPR